MPATAANAEAAGAGQADGDLCDSFHGDARWVHGSDVDALAAGRTEAEQQCNPEREPHHAHRQQQPPARDGHLIVRGPIMGSYILSEGRLLVQLV